MINFIRETAWMYYLLGSLLYLGYEPATVEWWAIFVPVLLLENLKEG